ncbi:phosphotransferase family protein [Mangrovihabitans endophyticus]|uniref:Aminoglycoside phosphotransferase domain-containing protein n=1 Tax=Mangrovihabitans endophyticus TaxID=1751298 RepID=A0A8J3FRC7_9ACTN|nr:phosphotransferase [Mangrovihabitans endophyticus]GGL14834.1 hypothetical protein GCM10012284_56940 [Mangrovihabitans endophyticus]
MPRVLLPDVAYGATAVRPGWHDLPPAVRDRIADALHGPITAARVATGGFTRTFAAVLETADGDRAFVKAAPDDDPAARWYAREAAITAALPPEVSAARPRWTFSAGGHVVLGLDAIDGRVPALPWSAADLAAALHAWRVASQALSPPPAALAGDELPTLAEILRADLSWWTEILAGRAPMPSGPGWLARRVPELAALEQGLPALSRGPGMLHGDLRIDNVLVDTDGRAWLCDWTWPCRGAAWFDTVTLLITAYASGLDADALLEPWQAPAGGVDGALAALAGYWMVRAGGPATSASPHSRQHHRFSGRAALSWLAARRGWPVDDLGAVEQA